MLALIEPGVPSTRLRLSRSFISRIGNLLRLSPDKQLDWFLHLRHMATFLRYSSYRQLPHISLFPTTETLRQDGSNILPWVGAHYIPREYPGKVTFFWASEGPYCRVEWLKVAKEEGEVHFIPGRHLSLLTEHLPDLAEHLKKCLSEARADRLCE